MSSSILIDNTLCYHCGEECPHQEITVEKKSFCCEGCKTVFELLNEYNLCTYYELDRTAGKTMQSGIERKRFEYLQDMEVQHKLVDFKHGDTVSITFFVPNIHCTSCVWLLENLQNIDRGILKGTVNFLKRAVTILYDDSKTNLRSVVELLTTIGYEPNLKLEQLNEQKPGHIDRSLWLKLGVAGFSFGNIMLFSFPEYLNMEQSGSAEMFRSVFGALNIALALPVLLFSSIDYLKSAWAALSRKGINLDVPISIGIIALFGRSVYEILSGIGAGYLDSFTGFIFFLLIGKVVHKKTFDQLSFNQDYKSYLPISVISISDGKEISIPVDRLEIGDSVIIRNQELIPADAILESTEIEIDYSFITGESEPILVRQGEQVFAGGKVLGNHAGMIISKKVEHSYLTQLWENEAFKNSSKDKTITSFADRISPYFTFSVLGTAISALLIWMQIDLTKAFTIFTAVLIIACPCALALSTPFTLGSTLNIMAFNGLYVRSTSVIEALSKATTFVFDKTGTITESNKSEIRFVGPELSAEEAELISNASRASIHPLSKAIFQKLKRGITTRPDFFKEVTGKGIFAKLGRNKVCIGNSEFLKSRFNLRILDDLEVSDSGSYVHIAINGLYRGCFVFQNKVRTGLSSLLHTLSLDFDLFLLSGDNEHEKTKLTNIFKGWKALKFGQSPIQKLEFVEKLKKNQKQVVMVGDGLNDAGALKSSHFGIAISDDMSSFSPACDAITNEKGLQKLATLVQFSKSSFNIIIASFVFSLMYNIIGLAFAVTGHLSPLVAAILMPLSSVSIMAFTTFLTKAKAKQLELQIWE